MAKAGWVRKKIKIRCLNMKSGDHIFTKPRWYRGKLPTSASCLQGGPEAFGFLPAKRQNKKQTKPLKSEENQYAWFRTTVRYIAMQCYPTMGAFVFLIFYSYLGMFLCSEGPGMTQKMVGPEVGRPVRASPGAQRSDLFKSNYLSSTEPYLIWGE